MIERARGLWKPWQKPWHGRVFGFSLAWWLLLAPPVIRALWKLLLRASLPDALDRLLPFSYVLLIAGTVFSLQDLSEVEASRTRSLALWFVLGVLAMVLAGALGLLPLWF